MGPGEKEKMAVFMDSGIFIALLNQRDKNHDQAKKLLQKLKNPDFGPRITTDYVLDEVVTTLWARTHRKSTVAKAYHLIRDTPEFVLFKDFSSELLGQAWEKWQTYAQWPEKPLSFTDCTILAFMEKEKITYLTTFDAEFDGLVTVISEMQDDGLAGTAVAGTKKGGKVAVAGTKKVGGAIAKPIKEGMAEETPTEEATE